MSCDSPQINTQDLQRYFDFLSGGKKKEIFSAWFCSEDGKYPVSDLGFVWAPAEKLITLARAVYENERGTLHVCLNRTSEKGRKNENVQAVRVLCVDIDHETPAEKVKDLVDQFAPGLLVESSPQKYHFYWKIEENLPFETWQEFQTALAVEFDGDHNLRQLSHSIRVPGIPRLTKTGETFVPRIVWHALDAALNYDDICALFPTWQEQVKTARIQEKKRKKAINKAVSRDSRYTQGGAELTAEEKVLLGQSRNRAVYDYVLQKSMAEVRDAQRCNAQTRKLSSGNEVADLEDVLSFEDALRAAVDLVKTFPQNGKPPLSNDEITRTAKSAYETAKKLVCESRVKATAAPADHVAPADVLEFEYDFESESALKENRFTEAAVLERIVQRYGSCLIRNDVTREILAFDKRNCVWKIQARSSAPEATMFVNQCIKDTLDDERFVAEQCCNARGEYSEKAHRMAQERLRKVSLGDRLIGGLLHCPAIRTAAWDTFDAVPEVVFVGNGALNMKTGAVREPTAEDLMLNRTLVEWDAQADFEEWEEFLAEVFQDNEDPAEMVSFMQELFGYSISGYINAQKIFCHYGDGSNGKSKVLSALAAISGEYATYIDPDDVVSKKNAYTKAMERIGAKIEGRRVGIVDDISVSTVWNEAFVKNLTSPVIRARGEYEKSRPFKNRCSLHLGLNRAPEPEAENEGILRRICLIPYPHRFDHSAKDSDAIDSLIRRNLAGILRWSVLGFQRYVAHEGFRYPAELQVAVDQYKEEHFTLETLVSQMFRAPKDGEECEPLFLTDLVREVNTYIQSEGKNVSITAEDLGRGIARKLKIPVEKMWCQKRKNAFRAFRIVRLYNEIKHNSII